MSPDQGLVAGPGHPLQDVVHVVEARDGTQVPLQPRQHDHLELLQQTDEALRQTIIQYCTFISSRFFDISDRPKLKAICPEGRVDPLQGSINKQQVYLLSHDT